MANYDALGFNAGKLQKVGSNDFLASTGGFLVKDGGFIGSLSDDDASAIAANGNVTLSQSLVVTGDLTVNGTSSTVNVETLKVDQPQIEMGLVDGSAPSSDLDKDVGMVMHYHNGSAAKVAFFGWDDSAGKATFIADASETANVFSGSVGTIVASFEGALSGNASTATALATGRTISITGDLAYTSPSFDGSGNVTAAGTLATVNSDVGSFGGATAVPVVTVNAKGLVTAVSTASIATSFDIAADSGSNDTVAGGETLTFSGTTNQVDTTVSNNEITFSLPDDILLDGAASLKIADQVGTDQAGASLTLSAQRSTGSEAGGDILFQTSMPSGSGSTVNSTETILTVGASGVVTNMDGIQQNTGLNTSSGTISRGEFVGADLAKGNSSDEIIGMHVSYAAAATSGSDTIVLAIGKQVVSDINTSSFSAGDKLYIDNSGNIVNSTSGITNNIWKVGYALDSSANGSIFLDIQHVMAL